MKIKDKKISIKRNIQTTDNDGFTVTTAQIIHSNIWAYYRQLSGTEIYANSNTIEDIIEDALFITNYYQDITPKDYIIFRGDIYDIKRIDDFEGYKTDLKIYAKKRAI